MVDAPVMQKKCNLRKGHTQQDYLCIIIFKLWELVYIVRIGSSPVSPTNKQV